MTTQDWINEQKIQAVQDRKDGKDYWTTDNLYTEADLIELLEAFALYNVVGRSEQSCQCQSVDEITEVENWCRHCEKKRY